MPLAWQERLQAEPSLKHAALARELKVSEPTFWRTLRMLNLAPEIRPARAINGRAPKPTIAFHEVRFGSRRLSLPQSMQSGAVLAMGAKYLPTKKDLKASQRYHGKKSALPRSKPVPQPKKKEKSAS